MNNYRFLLSIYLFALSLHMHSFDITSIYDLLPEHPEIEYIKCLDAQPFEYTPFPISRFPELQPHKGLFGETFILKIPHGQVCSWRGWIKIDNNIVSECIAPYYSGTFEKLLLECRPFPPVKKIKGRVAVITMLFDTNFGHWMYNILGRLALLEMNNIEYDWLYVTYDKPFMKETLALWGIDESKIIQPFGDTKYIEADELIVPSLIGKRVPMDHQYPLDWIPFDRFSKKWGFDPTKDTDYFHTMNCTNSTRDILPDKIPTENIFITWTHLCGIYVNSWVIDPVRNKFLSLIKDKKYTFPKKIFISRQDTSARQMTNEDEIFALLEPYGFKRYQLAKLSLSEKIALIHNAECIVAATGTALINLLFAKPKTTIIEIFQGFSDCIFYYLSQTLQLNHHCIKTKEFTDLSTEEHTYVDPKIILDFIEKNKTLFQDTKEIDA